MRYKIGYYNWIEGKSILFYLQCIIKYILNRKDENENLEKEYMNRKKATIYMLNILYLVIVLVGKQQNR
jgi:hypothetical protein